MSGPPGYEQALNDILRLIEQAYEDASTASNAAPMATQPRIFHAGKCRALQELNQAIEVMREGRE